jgi:hypothetical protein
MSDSFGMSRREMEAELRWMLRHVPSEPGALVRLLADAVVTLIEKNNAAVARALSEREAESGKDLT